MALDDVLGDIFGMAPKTGFESTPLGKAAQAAQSDAKKNRAVPQVRGKTIDGVFYVRADDVAAAMESQGVTGPLVEKLRRKS